MSTILWMSWARRRFLLPSLMKALEASIMKMPLRAVAFSLSSTMMQGRNARAVEQIGRQPDNALAITPSHNLSADVGLRIASEQKTLRKVHRRLARALEARQDVQDEREVAVLLRRSAKREAMKEVVRWVEPARPRLEGKGRIGHYEVKGLELSSLGVLEVRGGQHVVIPDFSGRAVMEDYVHPRQRGRCDAHFLALELEVEPRAA